MANLSLKAKLAEAGYNIDAFSDGLITTFENAVGGIAKSAQSEWIRLAQLKLKSSRDDYINGLRQAESFKMMKRSEKLIFEISLVGRMPNNYEYGMASFDMKSVRPGWLGGSKARTAKDGSSYVTIPFRHSTSGSPRFADTGKAKAAGLKTELRRTVKKFGLDRMIRAAGGRVVEGPVSKVPRGSAVHPYLKGLTRVQKGVSGKTKAGQRGSGQLMTWRRMSTKSPAESWIHPGITGVKLLPLVEKFAEREMSRIIEKIMGAAS